MIPETSSLPGLIVAVLLAGAIHLAWRAKWRRDHAAWIAESQRRDALESARDVESLARQDAIFNSMSDGVLVLDESGRIRFANQTFADIFSTTGILRGKTLLEATRNHELEAILHKTQAEGRVMDREILLPGLVDRWLEINSSTVTGLGRQKLGTVIVFHDLTRLKQLENTRVEFVANVSHELRTPLGMIKGYAETLLAGAKDDPDTATRYIQTLERHADRLTLLIEDLLAISSIESGQIQLNIQPVRLAEAIDKVFADFKPKAAEKQIRLMNQLQDVVVKADPGRLNQVLSNLVDNAIKYGFPGGRVIVKANRTAADQLEITVQDDGPGIPQDSLQRIFERFYRVDKARSRDQGGTGLGLAIVKHIVQAHGGKIWATSTPGKGACLIFTLPA